MRFATVLVGIWVSLAFSVSAQTPSVPLGGNPEVSLAAVQKLWPSSWPNPGTDSQAWAQEVASLKEKTFVIGASSFVVKAAATGGNGLGVQVTGKDASVLFDASFTLAAKKPADQKLLSVALAGGTLAVRLESRLAAVGRTRARVIVKQAQFGTIDASGTFTSALSIPASGIWEYESGNWSQALKPDLIDQVAVKGGGSYRYQSSNGPMTKPWAPGVWMSRTPITQQLYEQVMGTNPSHFKSGPLAFLRPVESITYFDAIRFANAVSVLEGRRPVYKIETLKVPIEGYTFQVVQDYTADGWRLPFSTEYLYATEGGVNTKQFTYAGSNDPGAVSWYQGNSGDTTQPVATKAPNELGLYDTMGNVSVWTDEPWSFRGEIALGGVTYDYPAEYLPVQKAVAGFGRMALTEVAKPGIGIRLVRSDDALNSQAPPRTMASTSPSWDRLWDDWSRAAPDSSQEAEIAAKILQGRWALAKDQSTVVWGRDGSLTLKSLDPRLPFEVGLDVDLIEVTYQRLKVLASQNRLESRVQIGLVPWDKKGFRVVLTDFDFVERTSDNRLVSWLSMPFYSQDWYRLATVPQGTAVVNDLTSLSATDRTNALLASARPLSQEIANWVRWSDSPGRYTVSPNPFATVDSLSWLEALRLCNLLSQQEGLEPVYSNGTKAILFPGDFMPFNNDPEGPGVIADFSKSGWRLPTPEEALLLNAQTASGGLSSRWLWAGGQGVLAESRGQLGVKVRSSSPDALTYGAPDRGAAPGLGLSVVRRNPGQTPQLPFFQGKLAPFPAVKMDPSQGPFVLINELVGPLAWLSNNPVNGESKITWNTTGKLTPESTWELRAPSPDKKGYVLEVSASKQFSSSLRQLAPMRVPPPQPEFIEVTGNSSYGALGSVWRFADAGNGWFRLASTLSGGMRFLWAYPSGDRLVWVSPFSDSAAQRWRLVPVSQIATLLAQAAPRSAPTPTVKAAAPAATPTPVVVPAPAPAPAPAATEAPRPFEAWGLLPGGTVGRLVDGTWVSQGIQAQGLAVDRQGKLWVVGDNRSLFPLESPGSIERGSVTKAAFAPDGTPYVLTDSRRIEFKKAGNWVPLAAPFKPYDFAIGQKGALWAISVVGDLWKRVGEDWVKTPMQGRSVTLDAADNPWLVGPANEVLRWNGFSLEQVPGTTTALGIAVGSSGETVVTTDQITDQGPVLLRSTGQGWVPVPSGAIGIVLP